MIPDYQSLMLPVLRCGAEQEINTRDVMDILASEYGLSEEEREHMLPSGKQRTFDNRVQWAKGYLKQAGLVRYPKRGFYVATDEGRRVLASKPERIDNKFLKQYEAFQDFQSRKGTRQSTEVAESEAFEYEGITPDELLRSAHSTINDALAADLLDRVRQASPDFFEQLIVDLLLAMGYGGSSEDAGRALGKSGDDGIDGVIDQDPLGVDQIYVQAKRYAEGNNIGSGAMRDFFGALSLKKAQKGIFFTTSSYSSSARNTARDLEKRIVLIDGERLARLMVKYNIGCRDEETVHLKKVDEDFFE